MVFYRKYRPQNLSEVLGQEHIKQALYKAFASGKLSHAYLFCGPKGTGKTSTARILAKMVNCEEAVGIDLPCNSCNSCKSITDGSSLDLIEIDAASNRGIDDIRQIRDNVKLAPTFSKKKIYIIDEVHMLSTEAFNALLKTLEEPPEHVVFVLATTEVHKIPATILSRVQRYDFKQATQSDLATAIERVAEKEKIEIREDAIVLLAKKSGGSFRDCLKLLDQLASSGEEITLGTVEGFVSSGSFSDVLSLLESIVKKDTNTALALIGRQTESGINLKEFSLTILDTLRNILLAKHAVNLSEKNELGETGLEALNTLAKNFSDEFLVKVLNSFQAAIEKMRFASVPALPLEIAVVESSIENPQVTSYQLSEKAQMSQTNIVSSDDKPDDQSKKDDIESSDMVTIVDKWNYILETVKPYNYSLEAMLKQVKLLSCDQGILVLEVPYSFHQRILEAPKSKNLLESVLADVLSKPVRVSTVLGQRPIRVEEVANVEVAADDEIIRVAAEIFNS